MNATERLEEIAAQLAEGKGRSETVREILSWFKAYRRGPWIIEEVKTALSKAGLRTEPDFESAYIDSPIEFLVVETMRDEAPEEIRGIICQVQSEQTTTIDALCYSDPTHRISKLAAANNKPLSVTPDAPLNHAVTLMLTNDFSQLPVMTSDRDVKGVVTWASIGSRLAFNKGGTMAREVMEQHQEIRHDASLFSAIHLIADCQYVLVRGKDQRIVGIVTASDLNLQFQQLSEPFLLLSEIENYIRRIISSKFTVEELNTAKDPSDECRQVTSVADLTFGEYIRLLENPDRWEQLRLPVDRKTIIQKLEGVRIIRNDVMHFDPDGIPPCDLEGLREFARFLQKLEAIGVI